MVLVSEMFSESFKWGGGDVIGQNHLAIKPNRMFNSELDFFTLIQERISGLLSISNHLPMLTD